MHSVLVEACVASVAQARAAAAAGADRLELCGPGNGGTTPSLALVEACVAAVFVPVHVMIRPHDDGFVIDDAWRPVMARDITHSIRAGARGVVFGALHQDGTVDAGTTATLVAAAEGAPVVFHRAFDAVPDQDAALDTLRALGVHGVLTSGAHARAVDGAATLRRLQERAGSALTIMAGGGVRADNVHTLLDDTHLHAVHARATDPPVFAAVVSAVRAWSSAQPAAS